MNDILHDFPIAASRDAVFRAISTPAGLDQWWTRRSKGTAAPSAEFELEFGPGYDWGARVVVHEPPRAIEFEMVRATPDWMGTRVGFVLSDGPGGTRVRFHHAGWSAPDDHYRTSSFCWAMYLRILKRHLEFEETVPYERRLDV